MKDRIPVIAKSLVSLIGVTLAILVLLMPSLSIQAEDVEKGSRMFPIFSSLVFYSDGDSITKAEDMSLMGLADYSFELSDEAAEQLNAMHEFEEIAKQTNAHYDYSDFRLMESGISTTRTFGKAIGFVIYLTLIVQVISWALTLVGFLTTIFAKTTRQELKAVGKMQNPSGAGVLIGAYVLVLVFQFVALGGLNFSLLVAETGYGYALVFTSGIQYLIAAIAIAIMAKVANSVIDKKFPIEQKTTLENE